MAFDLAATLRRLKPDKRTHPLVRRPDHELPFVGQQPDAGPPLLLDTTVYIDVLKGRAPPEVEAMLRVRQANHSSVAVTELANLFGRLDPAHPGTKGVLREIRTTIDDIPQHRLSVPTAQAFAEAGIVSGMIARLKGIVRAERQPLLNDASLFFHALETGSVLLSRNIVELDLIEQLVPTGRILLYRELP